MLSERVQGRERTLYMAQGKPGSDPDYIPEAPPVERERESIPRGVSQFSALIIPGLWWTAREDNWD